MVGEGPISKNGTLRMAGGESNLECAFSATFREIICFDPNPDNGNLC